MTNYNGVPEMHWYEKYYLITDSDSLPENVVQEVKFLFHRRHSSIDEKE